MGVMQNAKTCSEVGKGVMEKLSSPKSLLGGSKKNIKEKKLFLCRSEHQWYYRIKDRVIFSLLLVPIT
jgi:hypothetical protein